MRYAIVLAGWTAVLAWHMADAQAAPAPDSDRFRRIHEQEWDFRMREFPLQATAAGIDEYAAELGHVAEPDQRRRYEYWKGVRAALDDISCERLEHSECIDLRLFRKQMDDFIAAYETRAYLIPFNSDWGLFMEWARLPADTEFRKPGDYRSYLSRLPARFARYSGFAERGGPSRRRPGQDQAHVARADTPIEESVCRPRSL